MLGRQVTTQLEAALIYLENGFSVFPCRDKHTPLVKWKPLQKKLPTREQVEKWWTTHPDAMIGVALGKVSGVVRVDADSEQALEELQKLGGLPPTLTFRTPSGGSGFLLRYAEGMTTQVMWNGKGEHQELRFQSDGAYTILPYSTGYEWTSEHPIASIPQWLYDTNAWASVKETEKELSPKMPEPDEDVVLEAAEHLSEERADEYRSWIMVGQAFHSGGDQYFDAWVEFSRKSRKFKEGECKKKWDTFNRTGKTTLRSIVWWAQKDDPEWKVPRVKRFKLIHSREFVAGDYTMEWITKRLLVKGQPAVFGGRSKLFKTTMLVDFIASVASGTKFLGYFDTYVKRKVAIISGESGEATLKETYLRVCKAKNLDPAELDVYWGFELPQVSNKDDMSELAQLLREQGIEVVVIDPLYLCLLEGSKVNASNSYEMGPLLKSVTKACLDAGATPIFVVHSKKGMRKGGIMELDDIAWAGIGEHTRQWILLSPKEQYDPETGSITLTMNVGGSAGQSGMWTVKIEQGQLSETFDGRKWEVAVTKVSEEVKEKKKKEKVQHKNDVAAVLAHILRSEDRSAGISAMKDELNEEYGITKGRVEKAIDTLVEQEMIERRKVTVYVGVGNATEREADGVVWVDNHKQSDRP